MDFQLTNETIESVFKLARSIAENVTVEIEDEDGDSSSGQQASPSQALDGAIAMFYEAKDWRSAREQIFEKVISLQRLDRFFEASRYVGIRVGRGSLDRG